MTKIRLSVLIVVNILLLPNLAFIMLRLKKFLFTFMVNSSVRRFRMVETMIKTRIVFPFSTFVFRDGLSQLTCLITMLRNLDLMLPLTSVR